MNEDAEALPDGSLGRLRDEANEDDRVLVDAYLASRSGDSFRALYRKHTPRMYRLATGLLGGDHFAAEDAVQEAWLRATRRMDGFAWRSSLRTWLCGIVVNSCREIRRLTSAAGFRKPDDNPNLVPATAVRSETELRHTTIDLLRAIDSLPEGAREILVLHGIFGQTHEEISSILGIAPGTSKSQLHYARGLLRRRLNPREEREENA